MNKKDMFIKGKLQQDKSISEKANKIFDNIKGEFKMENNERKVIKMSFNAFLAIAASVVIVGTVGVNLYAKSKGRPNLISEIQALTKSDKKENTDEIAKELFEKGADEIRKLQYSSFIKEEYEVEGNLIEEKINGKIYVKTNEKYEKVVQKYGKIFTDKALENVLAERFANVDGVLYISYGGATGWKITNVEVEKINEKDGEIVYKASYNDVGINEIVSEEKQICEFKIKKVNNEYKISETNYCNLGQEQNLEQEDNKKTTILESNSLQNSQTENLKITEINIKKAPSKVRYKVGEDFDSKGMIVEATFSDGSIREITNYELANNEDLEINQKSVTIYYTQGDKEIEAIQPITVVRVEKIQITKAPNKVIYKVGESFDPTGMVVKATFSDGTTEEIINYKLANDIDLEKNQKNVLIYYTEGDREIEEIQEITVNQ